MRKKRVQIEERYRSGYRSPRYWQTRDIPKTWWIYCRSGRDVIGREHYEEEGHTIIWVLA